MKTTARRLVESTIKNAEQGLQRIAADIEEHIGNVSPNYDQICRLAIDGQRLQSELRQAKILLPLV